MLERADAPRVDKLRPGLEGGRRGGAKAVERRPLEGSVDLDGGVDEPAHAPAGEVGDERLHAGLALALPSLDGDPCPSGRRRRRRCDSDARAPATRPAQDPPRPPCRGRRGSRPRRARRSTASAVRSPPPTWTGTLAAVGDAPHVLEVHRLPRARPVEVDDVQRLGPALDPAPRGVEGVGVERGLTVVVALHQAHRACRRGCRSPDRGSRRQAATGWQAAANPASSSSPAVLDFSGWNWAPRIESRSTTAAKRSPHSAVSDDHLRIGGPGREGVHEVEGLVVARGQLGDEPRRPLPAHRFPAHVRDLQARRIEGGHLAGDETQPGRRPRSRSRTRTGAACPRQMPSSGRPAPAPSRGRGSRIRARARGASPRGRRRRRGAPGRRLRTPRPGR